MEHDRELMAATFGAPVFKKPEVTSTDPAVASQTPVPTAAEPAIIQPATLMPQPSGYEQRGDGKRLINLLHRVVSIPGISDVHLRANEPVLVRRWGELKVLEDAGRGTHTPVDESEIRGLLRELMPEHVAARLRQRLDADFSFALNDEWRFRVNMLYERGFFGLVLRLIPLAIPEFDDLGLPAPVRRFANLSRGLVLFTGPTGSGKSTSLAAILDHINRSQSRHIITIEDPIEFVHKRRKSLITHRQLWLDTNSFADGVKHALRQDPDIILIGEMRDRETVINALQAAETGHLVFSTLHTNDTVQTVNRMIHMFEPYEREPIRYQMAQVLEGVVSQRLLPHKNQDGFVALAEVMVMNTTIRDYIIRNQLEEIGQLLRQNTFEGMNDLNSALAMAVREGSISITDAMHHSNRLGELEQMLAGVYHGAHGPYTGSVGSDGGMIPPAGSA